MTFFATYFRWKWEMIFFLLSSSSIVEREKTEIIRWWLKNCQAPLNELLIRSSRKSEKKKSKCRIGWLWCGCDVKFTEKAEQQRQQQKSFIYGFRGLYSLNRMPMNKFYEKRDEKKTDIFISDILSRSSFSSFEAKTEAFYPKHFSLFFFLLFIQ